MTTEIKQYTGVLFFTRMLTHFETKYNYVNSTKESNYVMRPSDSDAMEIILKRFQVHIYTLLLHAV